MKRDVDYVQNRNVITVKKWFEEQHSDEEKRELFLYMDFAMRYIHDRDCCIYTFNPQEIEILNDSVKQVKFNTLLKMPDDEDLQNKLKNEDISNSSTLQILLYSKFPLNTKIQFIKENFDQFTTFLPETDIPYYRGVIERNASVYFTEYELERVKRENENLEKELNGLIGKDEMDDVERVNRDLAKMFDNDKINSTIYKKINGKYSDAAFLYILVYPTIFIVLALVVSFILFIIR